MSKSHSPIRLFETVVDECPYLEGEQSASILVDPDHEIDQDLFTMLSKSGFRRSGNMLYTPKCPTCNACVSVRIPVHQFKASRSQRRVWNKNSEVDVHFEPIEFKDEHFELYLKYQRSRHPDSSMCDDDPDKYRSFIESYYSRSSFLSMYEQEKLIGISVIDQFHGGISAVYTFFDPQYSDRSLGTFIILHMIKLARQRGIPHVYLGYWIEESSKMNYKANFKPLEGFIDRNWVTIVE